ncbi:MAG TPA: UDP-glucose/GDP-mannose dehydrogenase family protein [Blastocatellia bacterium]|nr:UDP-glucose/GDP-mannose dehydrogenase family protein [Blastocatellia bacterium]HMV84845.1 UDP-glucose/GDP-mannose dehydrogenase family protein [Blastocatellia bacterium]HMX26285.1 UDP-glucose/GDP-mannose dehydrogenase family protein [Blastocatellia bacterium]HMZ21603.1 UDP-glucose/GDP-mannose dehydrogenase family protein [Blastocatellia bacterium]
MRLSIFGLGYVGCVSAACFATRGHEVIGVDVNEVKVELINQGGSPVVEPGLAELIRESVNAKRLRATTDAVAAVNESDISLVCVGTPSNHNGSLDLSYIKRACQEIGQALEAKNRYHIVVLRSTMLPGTVETTVIPALEVFSGKRAGRDFGVAVNPEFLREGTSLHDFDHPPFTLIGADDEDAGAPVSRLYAHLDAPLIVAGVKEAEMVKYACNCFHALKVTFANEIGNVCHELDVDSHRVMEIFCRDDKLNLSPYYLKPGFAFGGSCLPKDLRALLHKAKEVDVKAPVLEAVLASNRQQVEKAADMILRTGQRRVAVLGLSFKTGTDDLRESPMATLIETLIGKGLQLSIYDREVELARLHGANKEFIERGIPHIASLLCSGLPDTVRDAEVVVIGKKDDAFDALPRLLNDEQMVIDLVRLPGALSRRANYKMIC